MASFKENSSPEFSSDLCRLKHIVSGEIFRLKYFLKANMVILLKARVIVNSYIQSTLYGKPVALQILHCAHC